MSARDAVKTKHPVLLAVSALAHLMLASAVLIYVLTAQ